MLVCVRFLDRGRVYYLHNLDVRTAVWYHETLICDAGLADVHVWRGMDRLL